MVRLHLTEVVRSHAGRNNGQIAGHTLHKGEAHLSAEAGHYYETREYSSERGYAHSRKY